MYRRLRFVGSILLLVMIAASDLCAKDDQPILIVMPARKHVVSLAFDVASLRPAFLITYQSMGRGAAPFMHIWDATKNVWRETNTDFYQRGQHFSTPPSRVYFLGANNEIPAELHAQPSWCAKQLLLSELDSMTLLNEFNETLHFSAREWKWLGGRHKLELKDLNEQRRRYGRYGPPKRVEDSGNHNTAQTAEKEETALSAPQTATVTPPLQPVSVMTAPTVEVTPPATTEIDEPEREPLWSEAPQEPVMEKGIVPAVMDAGSK